MVEYWIREQRPDHVVASVLCEAISSPNQEEIDKIKLARIDRFRLSHQR
jgi:hypothetical protein